MSSAVKKTLVLLIVPLLGAIGYWLYLNYEWQEEEINTGYQREARENPLLAAEHLIKDMGGQVTSIPTLTGMPPPGATLVLLTYRSIMGDKRHQQILDWVARGGHLVITPINTAAALGDKPDPLLAPIGVELHQVEYEEDEEDYSYDHEPVNLDVTGNDDLIGVDIYLAYYLVAKKHPPLWAVAGPAGPVLTQHAYGQGKITVVTDGEFIKNYEIGQYDHAAYLANILKLQGGESVWLVYGDNMPSLVMWLLKYAWMVLASAAVVLALWIWAGAGRFGMLMPEPQRVRRSLLEHIAANGRFLWQHVGEAVLLTEMRDSLLRKMRSRHTAWARLTGAELHDKIAQHCDMSAAAVSKAMERPAYGNQREFVFIVRTLEAIRRKL